MYGFPDKRSPHRSNQTKAEIQSLKAHISLKSSSYPSSNPNSLHLLPLTQHPRCTVSREKKRIERIVSKMLKALAIFNRKKNSRPFKDYYNQWFNTLKNKLLPGLRNSIYGSSPALISIHVEMLHHHFQSYYHALDLAASSDVSQVLFPDWRNSLEKPFLWLGDFHPYLFTNLVRSFLDNDSDDEDERNDDSEVLIPCLVDLGDKSVFSEKPWQLASSWKDPPKTLITQIEQIECGMRLMVPSMVTRMRNAQAGFVEKSAQDWLQFREKKEAAKAVVEESVKAEMDEIVCIFLDANRLRRTVLAEIISATTVNQAAQFLEELAQFLIGFRDHELLSEFEQCKTSMSKQCRLRH
ncbi:Transcription factor TGA like domain [Quillaja saponaria]|uniref:Transcription factor TGA like domain n=1 Tax=Quillaja saponaria TaxID=32244 RepID=A0AAD7P799_QUISA|nr:Transcription factor TGA like domain [Quillaja saponaria]KAJ7944771.1 Transcription factor TGA like domain [Quillaja saponaria]